MQCPNCENRELIPTLTREGLEIDRCGECGGIWLDPGELLLFARDPKPVITSLDLALKNPRPGKRLSPKTGEPMQVIVYPGGQILDYCPKTQGLWIDFGELKELLARNRNIPASPPIRAAPVPSLRRLGGSAAAGTGLLWTGPPPRPPGRFRRCRTCSCARR